MALVLINTFLLVSLFSKYSTFPEDYSLLLSICQPFVLNFRNETPKTGAIMQLSGGRKTYYLSLICDLVLAFLSWLSEVPVTTR